MELDYDFDIFSGLSSRGRVTCYKLSLVDSSVQFKMVSMRSENPYALRLVFHKFP